MNPPAARSTADASAPADRGAPPRDAARDARDAQLALLVQSAADGDCRAFEAFYDRTLGYAEAVARRLLRPGDVEDLLAEAYFEAWRCAARFDVARGSAVTWLLTIVRSRSLDLLRHLAARPDHVAATDDEPADIDSGAADPVDALWQRQSGQRLHAALATLDARERWTLGLAYFRDCSHADIARLTGLPLGTVKSVLARAQAKLRRLLGGAST